MAGLMDREMVRSRSRDKKGAVGGMRGWSDSESDDGKFQLKAPTKLAPVSGWKQAENKKPAGSQDIFLRPTPVISGIRLLPAPGLEDDEEEGSDGEKIRKPVASRGRPLKAASADDLAHVRAARKESAPERKADQEDAPKVPRKSKEDKAPKADAERESKEAKESKKRREDQGESRSKKEKDRNGTDRGRGDDGRARRGDEDRDRERKEDRKEDRDRREKPRDDRRDRRDDKDDRHERRDEDRRDRREEHDRHDRREGRDRDRRTDRRDRDRDRDRSRDRR